MLTPAMIPMTKPPSSSPRLRRRRAGAWSASVPVSDACAIVVFYCFRAWTSRMDAADGHRQKARSSGCMIRGTSW